MNEQKEKTPPAATDGVAFAIKAAMDFEAAMIATHDNGAKPRESGCQKNHTTSEGVHNEEVYKAR